MSTEYTETKLPKKGKGFRKIVRPSPELKKYQRGVLKKLNADIEKRIGELDLVVNGFRPNKNCVTAAKQHIGFDCTIIMDIQDFFDNCFNKDIAKVYPVIEMYPRLFHKDGYCAQGFVTSPALSNICISPALYKINSLLKLSLDKYAFTTYADDIQISFNLIEDTGYNRQNSIIALVKGVLESYNFKIKDSKTRIRYAKHGFRRILGINVGDTEIRASRRTMRKIRAAQHQGNYHSEGGLKTWAKCLEPKPKDHKKANQ